MMGVRKLIKKRERGLRKASGSIPPQFWFHSKGSERQGRMYAHANCPAFSSELVAINRRQGFEKTQMEVGNRGRERVLWDS